MDKENKILFGTIALITLVFFCKDKISSYFNPEKEISVQNEQVEKTEEVGEEVEQVEEVQKPKDVEVFGIAIGKTTEQELRKRYSVIASYRWKYGEEYKKLILKKSEFQLMDLDIEEVKVIVSSKGIVEALYLRVYGGNFFSIDKNLKEKYTLSYSDDVYVSKYIEDNVDIVLESYIFFPKLSIEYQTENIEQLKQSYLERQNNRDVRSMRWFYRVRN